MQVKDSLQQSNILDYLNSTSNYNFYGVERVSSIEDVAGRGAKLTETEVPKMALDGDNLSISGEIINFTTTSVLISIYIFFLMLYRKSISKVVRSFSFKDRVERINDLLDVSTQNFLSRGTLLMRLALSYFIANILTNIIQIDIPEGGVTILLFAIFCVIELVRRFVIFMIKYVSEDKNFFEYIKIFNLSYFSLLSIITIPAILIISHNIDFQSIISQVVLIIFLCIFSIIYIVYSFDFFRKQNISFLEYILYLCSAEIIPTSFIFLVIYRKLIT